MRLFATVIDNKTVLIHETAGFSARYAQLPDNFKNKLKVGEVVELRWNENNQINLVSPPNPPETSEKADGESGQKSDSTE